MDLTVRAEPYLDFEETARLAAEGFGAAAGTFTATRLEWLYRHAFSHGALVLGLFDGPHKVGQVTLLGQGLHLGGALQPAVALIDLFILPAFRSRQAIESLYGQVEEVCHKSGIRFILAVPNGKAVGVNRRFLKLHTAATLDIRVSLATPWPRPKGVTSVATARLGKDAALALLAPFEQYGEAGLRWTAEGLWNRLQDPSAAYGLHATDDLLLVAAPTVRKHVPMTLLCAFLPRHGAAVRARDVRALRTAAAQFHRRLVTVYIGRNARVPPPGSAVPARLRPSLMVVQARDLASEHAPVLDRFELIDFDFA